MDTNGEQEAIDAEAHRLRDLLVRFLIATALKDPRFESVISAIEKVVRSADAPRDALDKKSNREIGEIKNTLDLLSDFLERQKKDSLVWRIETRLEPRLSEGFLDLRGEIEAVKAVSKVSEAPEVDLNSLCRDLQSVQRTLAGLEAQVRHLSASPVKEAVPAAAAPHPGKRLEAAVAEGHVPVRKRKGLEESLPGDADDNAPANGSSKREKTWGTRLGWELWTVVVVGGVWLRVVAGAAIESAAGVVGYGAL